MPQPPLEDPSNPTEKIAGLARAVPATAFLFSTLLAFNAAQTASLAVRPLSRQTFRKFNRWAADTWWGMCVQTGELLYDVGLELSGDDVPERENAIVIANHQQMADITFLMAYARSKHRLGDLKWFAKKPVKYVPGVGWGMWFLDCPFLERNWADDRGSIARSFESLLRDRVPMWLISFPEGTRLTPEKLEASRLFASQHSMFPPSHTLVPRTKGFVVSVHALRDHVRAVYDLTIGYPNGVPSLWQFIQGFARKAYIHVKRHPIEALPSDDALLATWLLDRFQEKDALLDTFYKTGAFASG